MSTETQELIYLLSFAVRFNKQEGRHYLTRNNIPSSVQVLSKHGNRCIVKYNKKVYRVKFRDFSEHEGKITYQFDWLITEMDNR